MGKKMGLTGKLSLIIGCVLAVILILLALLTMTLSSNAIKEGIAGELSVIAQANGNDVQNRFDVVNRTAVSMQSYLDFIEMRGTWNPQDNQIPSDPTIAAMYESMLYPGRSLSRLGYDSEQYMVSTALNTLKGATELSAMGVMFEPNYFQPGMETYGFWVTRPSGGDEYVPRPFATYQEYQKENSYRIPVQEKRSYTSPPYEENGEIVISYGTPILHENQVAGVLISNLLVSQFSSVDASTTKYPSLWATVYDEEGNIVWDSQSLKDVGRNMAEFTPNEKELKAIQDKMVQGELFQLTKSREDGSRTMCFYSPIQVGDDIWWSMTGVYSSDIQQVVNQTMIIMLIVSVLALIVLLVMVGAVLRRMLAPMRQVVNAANEIAKGNLDVQVPVTSEDEIGQLAHVFQTMTENLRAMISDLSYLLDEMSNGNFQLKTRVEELYIGEYQNLLLSIRRINRTLSRTLSQINSAADQVASGSNQVAAGAQSLSQGATEQASAIQELAATTNDILRHVTANADLAESANQQTEQVNLHVSDSHKKMQDTLLAMDEIQRTSNEIGAIIQTIEGIAFQTNILALNAAVEAARAGAAGKGFAVVAEEVRNLAAKSAEASQNTAVLIESSLAAIQNGRSSMDETAKSLDLVVDQVGGISKRIEEISYASQQQAESIAQITQGVDQISSVVQTNSATSEESAATSQELSAQAGMLKELIGQFHLRDDDV